MFVIAAPLVQQPSYCLKNIIRSMNCWHVKNVTLNFIGRTMFVGILSTFPGITFPEVSGVLLTSCNEECFVYRRFFSMTVSCIFMSVVKAHITKIQKANLMEV